ncbi:hypothetical protein CTAYLR_009456 [Chrysophaeum taylorii]|uniref:HSF-type DNA-binding domain-containing protein n=1 Tax=Chrysophaeum taylorii TaxID=2483200 RepID=A0AAD7U828_9STRA|nr:hypothetical protein CTAYLR_009456 [Chrysophaeum taylorii]
MDLAQSPRASLTSDHGGVPPDYFVIKLYQMLREQSDVIAWDPDGGIIIEDRLRLEATLSIYFRHNRFTSFQRQLNNFGFHKKRRGAFSAGGVGRKGAAYGHPLLAGKTPEAVLRLRRDARPRGPPEALVAAPAATTSTPLSVLETLADVAASALGETRRNDAVRVNDDAMRIGMSHNDTLRDNASRENVTRNEATWNDAKRIEAKRVEATRVEATRTEAARTEAARTEAPRIEAPRNEAPRNEALRIDAPAPPPPRVLTSDEEVEEGEHDDSAQCLARQLPPPEETAPPPAVMQPRPRRARPFPCVLRDMIEDSPDEVLRWSDDGCVFVVADAEALCATVLPKYFRHCRLASFQRQLSLYQFRRARLSKSSPLYASTRNGAPLAYHHALFARNCDEQTLRAITRAPPKTSAQFIPATQLVRHDTFDIHRGYSPATGPIPNVVVASAAHQYAPPAFDDPRRYHHHLAVAEAVHPHHQHRLQANIIYDARRDHDNYAARLHQQHNAEPSTNIVAYDMDEDKEMRHPRLMADTRSRGPAALDAEATSALFELRAKRTNARVVDPRDDDKRRRLYYDQQNNGHWRPSSSHQVPLH